jgi:diguanylate cyclase (GGDEF)-like protein
MNNTYAFLSQVLDSITEHIVVIDKTGEIQFVNKSWTSFGKENHCVIDKNWDGVNYIDECDKASNVGDGFGTQAANGIRSVINKKKSTFYFEYPCHSPDQQRWFMMRVSPFTVEKSDYFVISHQNITERKMAEDEVRKKANIDGLTQIPNRRTFDDFLSQEWRRCLRHKQPICLAIIDLDYFKILNDTYGHQCGDDCLIEIGKILKSLINRPGDLCARYGGEEFALVLGNTSLEHARQLSLKLLDKILALKIPNEHAPSGQYLTASIGLAEIIPSVEIGKHQLINCADKMLYAAKDKGRNRVES